MAFGMEENASLVLARLYCYAARTHILFVNHKTAQQEHKIERCPYAEYVFLCLADNANVNCQHKPRKCVTTHAQVELHPLKVTNA